MVRIMDDYWIELDEIKSIWQISKIELSSLFKLAQVVQGC